MGTELKLDPIALPSTLKADERKMTRAMADEALKQIKASGRIPVRTGQFKRAHKVLRAGRDGASVGATGQRSITIATKQIKLGNDIYNLTAPELAAVVAAGKAEFDRQVRAGIAGVIA